MTMIPASPKVSEPLCDPHRPRPVGLPTSALKTLQRLKIRQLRDALLNAGLRGLNEQAEALGLPRSTAWAVLKGNHKGSGLSATIINRMLRSPRLPPVARAHILDYVREKAAGSYGASTTQRRRFVTRISHGNFKDGANLSCNLDPPPVGSDGRAQAD
jgi:hypothetical protein